MQKESYNIQNKMEFKTTMSDVKESNNNEFMQKVKDYIKKNTIGVVIMTPCYGSVCFVNFIHCLINTLNMFRDLGIAITVEFCKNDSLVSRARNNLLAKAMSNPTTSHMIFIDNDITWDPIDILKLIISDKSLIGGVYPLKRYDWSKIIPDKNTSSVFSPNMVQSIIDRKNNSQLKSIISDTDMVQHNLLKYNINFLNSTLSIENNLTKVRHIATGFMMIKRNTIEQMMLAYPATKYTDDVGFLQGDENKYAYALFDCGVEDDHYYSEDWLFCHRWSKMGGNIYIDVSINLKHTGLEDYNGSFIASII